MVFEGESEGFLLCNQEYLTGNLIKHAERFLDEKNLPKYHAYHNGMYIHNIKFYRNGNPFYRFKNLPRKLYQKNGGPVIHAELIQCGACENNVRDESDISSYICPYLSQEENIQIENQRLNRELQAQEEIILSKSVKINDLEETIKDINKTNQTKLDDREEEEIKVIQKLNATIKSKSSENKQLGLKNYKLIKSNKAYEFASKAQSEEKAKQKTTFEEVTANKDYEVGLLRDHIDKIKKDQQTKISETETENIELKEEIKQMGKQIENQKDREVFLEQQLNEKMGKFIMIKGQEN